MYQDSGWGMRGMGRPYQDKLAPSHSLGDESWFWHIHNQGAI